MKRIFIDEELRTLQSKLRNDKESENLVKRAEAKFEVPNIKLDCPKLVKKITSEKNVEKIVAEKTSEKIVSEKLAEIQKPKIGVDLLKVYQGVKNSNNNDRLL